MLAVALLRNSLRQFLATQHIGFSTASWYWHFVDVVWLLLFLSVYWWGGL
jgi:cytochrome c oxidase subunit 3